MHINISRFMQDELNKSWRKYLFLPSTKKGLTLILFFFVIVVWVFFLIKVFDKVPWGWYQMFSVQ